jgi:sec-independent protein translocase protein TatA
MEYIAFGLGSMGPLEWGIILVIVLVIFGAGKLPNLGKSLGSGIRNFNKSIKGDDEDDAPMEIDDGGETVSNSSVTSQTTSK